MAKVYARKKSNLRTALDYAVFHGHLEIVKLLAGVRHAPLGSDGPQRVQYLSVALASAARAANLEMCEILVSEGAEVNFIDQNSNCTALYFASGTKNLGLVQYLLKIGADPNPAGESARPLFLAALNNSVDIAQALLVAGADVRSNGESPLGYIRSLELFHLFLQYGADPNYEDSIGGTPLHYMYDDTNGEAYAELLLQFGARPEKANEDGDTPVDVAMQENKPEIVKVLEPFVQDSVLKMKIATWLEERE
ncbi:ankyrin repeat-containing domain protein [Mycena sanguinolenta]|nr:ankyrin repeat-containing domain protein [Mycena sanguinolenta]